MFTLIKIENSGRNVPEPIRLTVSAAVNAPYGTPLSVKGGVATPLSASTTAPATHILLAAASGTSLLCARVTPDMVFEAPLSASPASMKVGTEYALSADGTAVSATAVSGSVRGAVLVDTCGATQAGDKILVRFAQ